MFISSRGGEKKVSFSQAILNPSAEFGGLFVPEKLPYFDKNFLQKALNLTYQELALEILKSFEIDIKEEVLKQSLSLYDNFDDKNSPVIIKEIDKNLYSNELYHGPTRAFKDMALVPFGYIFSHLAKENNQKFLILTATSGDTGPATLNTFKNKQNIQVACLYPSGGTSDVQRLQMVCEDGKNLHVIGINGNFDDAQNALKTLLNSASFKDKLNQKNISLSAANSVNFGRIIFQIIYHVYAFLYLVKNKKISLDDKIYITVPSGNFGNALGAYYAKKMGIGIEKIILTSNKNNILTELFNTGIYDLRDKKLLKTISPAMDILISSNVERLLYEKLGSKKTRELMQNLANDKIYKLNKTELESLKKDFLAINSDDEFALNAIKKSHENGYILDPHTATCLKSKEFNLNLINVICSTAEWTKFAPSMSKAILNEEYKDEEALEKLSKQINLTIPNSISQLFSQKIIHDEVIEKENIQNVVLEKIKDF